MCVTLNFGNSGKIIFAKQDVKYSNNRCKISNVDGQVQNEARPLRCLGTAQGPPFMDRLSWKNPIEMDGLGVPPFMETHGNSHFTKKYEDFTKKYIIYITTNMFRGYGSKFW